MLPNERFALACRAYYEEQGLIVDETNGEFAHCPYPEGMGETGYYLLWEHHQQQGLLQSKDLGKRCFWVGDAKKWLTTCNPMPEDYFGLWDIYEEFVVGNGNPMFGKRGELSPMHGRRGALHPAYGKRGELHPMYGKRGKLSPMYGRKGELSPVSKKVEIIFPDGSKKQYVSATDAALSLNCDRSYLIQLIRKNQTLTKGRFVGYIFRYFQS